MKRKRTTDAKRQGSRKQKYKVGSRFAQSVKSFWPDSTRQEAETDQKKKPTVLFPLNLPPQRLKSWSSICTLTHPQKSVPSLTTAVHGRFTTTKDATAATAMSSPYLLGKVGVRMTIRLGGVQHYPVTTWGPALGIHRKSECPRGFMNGRTDDPTLALAVAAAVPS